MESDTGIIIQHFCSSPGKSSYSGVFKIKKCQFEVIDGSCVIITLDGGLVVVISQVFDTCLYSHNRFAESSKNYSEGRGLVHW